MSKYKVGDKVVVKITGVSKYVECYEVAHTSTWNTNRTERVTEPLSTYTEPLEAKIRRQAAEITRLLAENKELKKDLEYYHTGTDICDMESVRITGQNEAWELARKCMLMTDRERKAIFGSGHNALYGVLTYFDYKHAATKVAEWEKAKEEIKVGDVCMSNTGNCFAIRTIDHEKGNVEILWKDLSSGIVTLDFIKSHCTNTDRRIDIDSISQQIGGKEK